MAMKTLAKRSDIYVCWNPEGFTEHTPIAVVLKKTDKTVTYDRYIDHGRKKYKKPVTVSAEDFENYYHPVNDFECEVLKCLGYMELYDYDEDSFGGLISDE